MSDTPRTSTKLERWIICVLGVLPLWFLREQYRHYGVIQILFILGALGLVLEAVFFSAAWRHGLRWFFSRAALRFYLWAVAGLISAVVLFYAEESWRGKRAWAALQREVAACGESLELSSVFPPQVADEENFALAPGVAELIAGGAEGTNSFTADRRLSGGPLRTWPETNWVFGHFTDLASWQRYFRNPTSYPDRHNTSSTPARLDTPASAQSKDLAADVLLALGHYEAPLATLQAASARPQVRYPADYAAGMFARPYPDQPRSGRNRPLHEGSWRMLQNLFSATHILCLRASARLAQDQPQPALDDVWLALQLTDTLRSEPFWHSYSFRHRMLMCCLQPVWEGIALHRWTDPQLKALQQRLGGFDPMSEFPHTIRLEALTVMNMIDHVQAWLAGGESAFAQQMATASESERLTGALFKWFYPRGWLLQDKVWVYRTIQRVAKVSNVADTRVAEKQSAEIQCAMRQATDPALLVLIVPMLKQMAFDAYEQGVYLRSVLQQAQLACSVERYRLAHGEYPATLDPLVPGEMRAIPTDLVATPPAPLRYRTSPDGGFVVYSVGLNRVDDGGKLGVPPWPDWQDYFPDLDEGDWVWSVPGPKQ